MAKVSHSFYPTFTRSFSFIIIFTISTICTNVILCISLLRDNRVKNKSLRFLLSLAAADLAVGFVIMPVTALRYFKGESNKVGCVLQTVILPEFRLGQNMQNDHREDSPHFIIWPLTRNLTIFNEAILNTNALWWNFFRNSVTLASKSSICLIRIGNTMLHGILESILEFWLPTLSNQSKVIEEF